MKRPTGSTAMVSGDTWAETSVGITLSNESDVLTRTQDEDGGEAYWVSEDYLSWFFADKTYLFSVYDEDEGLIRLEDHRLPPDAPQTFMAETAEAATNVLQEAVDAAQTAVLDAMTDPDAKTATFAARPGFYYAIEYGSDLSLGANTEGKMATGPAVDLDKPTDMSPASGFFRVKVSTGRIQEQK